MFFIYKTSIKVERVNYYISKTYLLGELRLYNLGILLPRDIIFLKDRAGRVREIEDNTFL